MTLAAVHVTCDMDRDVTPKKADDRPSFTVIDAG